MSYRTNFILTFRFRSFTRHSRNLLSLALLFCITLASCSHKKPYINDHIKRYHDTCECAGSCETDENVNLRILFIGDAGDPIIDEADEDVIKDPTLISLYLRAKEMPGKTTIIFLGDNIYPNGLPKPSNNEKEMKLYNIAMKKLDAQLLVVKESKAQGIFIPGNHDWAEGTEEGLNSILRQEQYITNNLKSENSLNEECFIPRDECTESELNQNNIKNIDHATRGSSSFLPKHGFPGPCMVDIKDTRLIFIDSHWWLHDYEKPIKMCTNGNNSIFTSSNLRDFVQVEEKMINELKKVLMDSKGKYVIIIAHHPLTTHGEHGGFFDWKDYIFPGLEVRDWLWVPIPLAYPSYRWFVARHDQDVISYDYDYFIRRINEKIDETNKKPFIYAAGHDHSIQVLKETDEAEHVLVSGAGSSSKVNKSSVTDDEEHTLFAHLHTGFIEVDFMNNEEIRLRVIEPDDSTQCKVVYATQLETKKSF